MSISKTVGIVTNYLSNVGLASTGVIALGGGGGGSGLLCGLADAHTPVG